MQAPSPGFPHGAGRPHTQPSGPVPQQPPNNLGHSHDGQSRNTAPPQPSRPPQDFGPTGQQPEPNLGRHDASGDQASPSPRPHSDEVARRRLSEPPTDPNLPGLRAQDSGGSAARPLERLPESEGADNSFDAVLNPDPMGSPSRVRDDADIDEAEFPQPRMSHVDAGESHPEIEHGRDGDGPRSDRNGDDHSADRDRADLDQDPWDAGNPNGGDRPDDGADAGEHAEHDAVAPMADDHPRDRPSIDDLIPRYGADFDESALFEQVKKSIDGTYAGLRVEVHGFSPQTDSIGINAKIFDSSGNEIGYMTRDLIRVSDSGPLLANHRMLRLDANVQAGGFAREFNSSLEKWYKKSGVENIHLHANIDVGSYAWARQGYEFANHDQAVEQIRPRLDREIAIAKRNLEELRSYDSMPIGLERYAAERKYWDFRDDLDKAEDIRERFHVGSPRFPSPNEIAELFRPADLEAGESKDLSWAGKRIFMEPGKEIGWHGVKKL